MLRPILLAEDNPNDVELTLTALHSLNLANEVVVVSDGADVLDFLHRRNAFSDRPALPPAVILLDLFGGPSHIDTFDPKPDAKADVRGGVRGPGAASGCWSGHWHSCGPAPPSSTPSTGP